MATAVSWLTFLEPLTEPAPPPALQSDHSLTLPPVPDAQALWDEADAALASARAEALELVEDARVQAEALREAAWQEGFHNGQQAAQAAVESEGRVQWQAQKDALRAEVDGLISHIVVAREELWRQQEPEMVGLALDIARQVVKAEVKQNPEVVRQVITNAIRRITDKDNVRVRISVADAPHVKSMREDILEMVDGLRHLEIIDDRRVGEGGCVIETNAGTIDAKIETQLAEIARALEVTENE